jgi:hypothetical protein
VSLKNKVKKLVERLTSTHIYRDRDLPRGTDFFQDIADLLPMYRVDIVFDVGAHAGGTSKMYLTGFPSSHIYCFEPVGDTFHQLQDNLKGNGRV